MDFEKKNQHFWTQNDIFYLDATSDLKPGPDLIFVYLDLKKSGCVLDKKSRKIPINVIEIVTNRNNNFGNM